MNLTYFWVGKYSFLTLPWQGNITRISFFFFFFLSGNLGAVNVATDVFVEEIDRLCDSFISVKYAFPEITWPT